MDHRTKHKSKKYKNLRRSIGDSSWSYIWQRILRYDTNSTSKNKKIEWNSSKLYIWCFTVRHQESEKKPTEGKNIFANHTSDKEFLSRIYRELLQVNKKATWLLVKMEL